MHVGHKPQHSTMKNNSIKTISRESQHTNPFIGHAPVGPPVQDDLIPGRRSMRRALVTTASGKWRPRQVQRFTTWRDQYDL